MSEASPAELDLVLAELSAACAELRRAVDQVLDLFDDYEDSLADQEGSKLPGDWAGAFAEFGDASGSLANRVIGLRRAAAASTASEAPAALAAREKALGRIQPLREIQAAIQLSAAQRLLEAPGALDLAALDPVLGPVGRAAAEVKVARELIEELARLHGLAD